MGIEEPIVNQNESFDIQEGVDTIECFRER